MDVRDKRILLTGASSGIGADLARELAGAGARLVLAARRKAELDALCAEIAPLGTPAVAIPADLSTAEGADELADAAVIALGGGVDILINNAGVEIVAPIWQLGAADAGDRLLQVNVMSPLRLTHRLLPGMIERGAGTVVFVASVAGWVPMLGGTYYSASKAAIARAAETIRIDLKGSGVRVCAVYPGPVVTPMFDRVNATETGKRVYKGLPRGTSPELARRIVDALQYDEETVFYPRVYRVPSWFMGLSRWFVGVTAPSRQQP